MCINVFHTGLCPQFLRGQQTSHCDDVKDFYDDDLARGKFDKYLISMDQILIM